MAIIKAKQLIWSAPSPPTGVGEGQYPYDHVKAKTPIGTYSIEWKSWKKYGSFTVQLDSGIEHFICSGNDLDDAKAIAQTHYQSVLDKVLEGATISNEDDNAAAN